MKISQQNWRYFLIGSLILVPFNFFFLQTQIFFVQTLLVIFLLTAIVLKNPRIKTRIKRNDLMLDFFIYASWVLFSFLLNLIFSFDSLEIQSRRIISVAIAFLLMSTFFIGRSLKNIDINTEALVKGIFFTYLLVLFYVAFVSLSQPSLDLYLIRSIIGQRLPFVIAYVTAVAAVYYFLRTKRNYYYFTIMISGTVAVIFSLTRAAYIQLFFSFIIVFIKEIRKYFFRGALVLIILFSIGFVFLKLFGNAPSVKQMTSRFELLFDYKAQSSEDVSGHYRLLVWEFLFKKMAKDPIRIIVGFGQLGPTHVAHDLVLPDGTSGNFNAHSQYVDIIVREGVVGLLLFLWLCYKALRIGFSIREVPENIKLFVQANSVGLVGVMFYSLFHETFRYPLFGFYFWLYIGMLSKFVEYKKL